MKVERNDKFEPIIITFESFEEYEALTKFIGNTSEVFRIEKGDITKEQSKILSSLYYALLKLI